jgi:hypothetical protein
MKPPRLQIPRQAPWFEGIVLSAFFALPWIGKPPIIATEIPQHHSVIA